MSKQPVKLSIIFLIGIVVSDYLLCGAVNISPEKNYECAGKNDNGMVVNREFPKLHFSGRQIKISGSDIFSAYHYEICGNNGSRVSFATQAELCRSGHGTINSLKDSYGSFNLDSGQLSLYGAQGLSGEYQCKVSHNN